MTDALLLLILVSLWVFAYKAKPILDSQQQTAKMMQTAASHISKALEPQFTCYFCNNKFPISQRIEISNYSYCEEHANRGHITRSN